VLSVTPSGSGAALVEAHNPGTASVMLVVTSDCGRTFNANYTIAVRVISFAGTVDAWNGDAEIQMDVAGTLRDATGTAEATGTLILDPAPPGVVPNTADGGYAVSGGLATLSLVNNHGVVSGVSGPGAFPMSFTGTLEATALTGQVSVTIYGYTTTTYVSWPIQ
jgi:hypothetical protein